MGAGFKSLSIPPEVWYCEDGADSVDGSLDYSFSCRCWTYACNSRTCRQGERATLHRGYKLPILNHTMVTSLGKIRGTSCSATVQAGLHIGRPYDFERLAHLDKSLQATRQTNSPRKFTENRVQAMPGASMVA